MKFLRRMEFSINLATEFHRSRGVPPALMTSLVDVSDSVNWLAQKIMTGMSVLPESFFFAVGAVWPMRANCTFRRIFRRNPITGTFAIVV